MRRDIAGHVLPLQEKQPEPVSVGQWDGHKQNGVDAVMLCRNEEPGGSCLVEFVGHAWTTLRRPV